MIYVHLNNFGIWKTKHQEEIKQSTGFWKPRANFKAD